MSRGLCSVTPNCVSMSCGSHNQEGCRCPIEGDKSLGLEVIECVSKVHGDDPEAQPPLHEAIDPDALNNLFRDRNSGEVTFTYLDYEITVNGDAVITRRVEERVSAD